MQLNQELGEISIGATVLALVAQPVWAAPTEVTAVRLTRSASGVEVVLDTQENNRPQVFTVNRGNSAVAEITNTQLRLPGGKSFRQNNPAPGIASVAVNQLDMNTIRVIVSGTTRAPTGQVLRRSGPGLVLGFSQPSSNEPNLTPPSLPRAVAPPVGDIAVASVDATPDSVDLGTSKSVSMTLRKAPVEVVLAELARAAGLNIVYIPASDPGRSEQSTTTATAAGQTTTTQKGQPANVKEVLIELMDVKDEPVQEVFNYVLRTTGLQANRVGRTIFVGKDLPYEARNVIVRTYRLNQIKATASGTNVQVSEAISQTGGSVGGTSSEAEIDEEDSSFSLSGGTTGSLAASSINRGSLSTVRVTDRGAKETLESFGANEGGTGNGSNEEGGANEEGTDNGGNRSASRPSSGLLSGLEVVADARANSITLIGSPRTVNIATNLLRQMDLRRRQVAVSVKIVDVDLTKSRTTNASLQYGAGVGSAESITASFVNGFFQIGAPIGSDFLLNILGRIRDDDAKILTSPTLMVQEGSSAQVNLTQEIFSGIKRETTAVGTTGALPTITETPIIRPAGVILNMSLDRIDDNGFVTLNISPEVSAPSGTFEVAGEEGTLLQQRRLETGQIRLRDGQTLVLTGIIQDEDRVTIDKVPILGDIPLLGRLFRRDSTSRTRQELVIVVTPRILNDSDQSSFGYKYKPSPEVEKMLNPQDQ